MLKEMDRRFLNKIAELSGMPPKREKRPGPLNLSVSVIPDDINDPDAAVPCILDPVAKRIFLGTPGFPKPLQRQPVRHRIAPSEGKGLGAFATVDMDAGECVISERPLVLATTDGACSYVEAKDYKIRDKTEKLFEEAVSKQTPKRRASFMKLCGVERENPRHPLSDIYQNTSVSIVYPRPPGEGFYAGVCKDIARLNHRSVSISVLKELQVNDPIAAVHRTPTTRSIRRLSPSNSGRDVQFVLAKNLLSPTAITRRTPSKGSLPSLDTVSAANVQHA
jgi:hypothetical protein